jgi:LmbE family N-acetylglucosaminyl deacetylase
MRCGKIPAPRRSFVEDHRVTLMAVHAHPDDEASSTGGLLARSASEGVRTVVVTCTNGELGDDVGGAKPNEPGHDPARVVATRRKELEESCAILGVEHLELLGFHDSGMIGWAENDRSGSFWSTGVTEAAAPLVALMERYQPDVVVTYDANGFYGHPDHIQAHRITIAAAESTGIPQKIFFPTFPRSILPVFAAAMVEVGEALPEPPEGASAEEPGTPDALVSAWIDCTAFVARKRAALGAHRSQIEDTFFRKMTEARFSEIFAVEAYLAHLDRTETATPASDLFAGLR